MADNTTTSAVPAGTSPVPEQPASAEHTLPAADAQPILDVLNGLAEPEPNTQAVPAPDTQQPKKDGGFEPLGTIINRP
ncbi:hypothetical protein GCM10010430_49140 [Kitasatospora cystarginea]|uniref:Uncharacterized protein n=1 Tax=Kitasatospora cystarginea TaxID=58350 RepID=A0ABN3EI28_9ACTN